MKNFLNFLTICAIVIITAGSVMATDYYVRTDGNDSNTGLTNDAAGAWLTINRGTDPNMGSPLVSGDILNIADGTYTIISRIWVKIAGITITGNTASPGNVIVQYSPAKNNLVFDMRASNVTIEGIKVTGGKTGFWFDQSAVTGCTISNCIVDFVEEYGIYMKNGGSGHTIDLCTISNTGQTYTGAPAVLIENCLDVTFSNNTLSSISDKGVYVRVCNASSAANRVEVTGNTLSGCSYPCVQVFQSPYTYIYYNTISSTGDKGINIIGPNATSQAERVVVEGNSISDCPWGGILLTHDRYTYIYNNTIFSTGDKGISIANGENVTSSAERIIVEGNNVSGTKYPGIQVAYAVPYTYIYNNTLSGCNYYGADGTGDWDYASIHVDDNCGNTIVESNDISDGINGIQIWSNNCPVTNNTIYDMGLTYADTKATADGTYYNSGIIIGSNWLTNNFKPTGTTIAVNNIHDNYWGLYVRDYATLSPGDPSVLSVTAMYNYWGDASGPSGEGPGAGDTVSTNVDFCYWLDAAYPGGIPVYPPADAGEDATIYIGYPPYSTQLNAMGGVSYSWSPTEGLSDPNIANPIADPESTTNYTVTVTDAYGCIGADEVTVTVIDVRCGKKMDKVLVCKVPPGNPGNAHTVCVSPNAVPALLEQGSYLGPCDGDEEKSIIVTESSANPETFFVHAYPNPFKEACTIEVFITELTNAKILITDMLGRNVGEIFEGSLDAGVHTFTWNNVNIGETNSIYFLQVFTDKETKIMKLMTRQ
ncbi:MAG: right-handed parallel beta-helix repeat-containing protein [Bacteroidales bacterium]|nr:right-handed parallel beta-helix repeat-containing protein [Bacteroidales bacterium]